MIRKVLSFGIPAGLALLVVSQWPDMVRYLKIKHMSCADAHPENVPVKGTPRYRQS
jgi:hypothetical protein